MAPRVVVVSLPTVGKLDRILQENKVQSVSDPLKRANLEALSTDRSVGVLAGRNNRWLFHRSCLAEAFAVDGRLLCVSGKKDSSFIK